MHDVGAQAAADLDGALALEKANSGDKLDRSALRVR